MCKNAVDAAEIDEGAIAGDVFDCAFENDSLLENLQNLLLERLALFFKQRAAGDHDVAAAAVELENREAVRGADEAIEIAVGPNIDVRAGQECRYADIDFESAFDLADNPTFDASFFIEGFFEVFPNF